MQILAFITLAAYGVSAACVPSQGGGRPAVSSPAAQAPPAQSAPAQAPPAQAPPAQAPPAQTAPGGTVTRGATTLVLKEVGGVPGNECLTFRNNGEIVDAACVNAAADRQLTPSTLGGTDVLLVQRSFSNGFRPDLVGKQACVGFNGTHFRATDCAANNFEAVSLVNGQLVSTSGACQSGHDRLAQVTVDRAGQNCARLTTTTVTPTAP